MLNLRRERGSTPESEQEATKTGRRLMVCGTSYERHRSMEYKCCQEAVP